MSQINIGIFGLGRFGNALVGTLNSLKCENTIHIRVLDKDPKKVEAVKDLCDDALILDLDLDDEVQLQQHFEGLNVAVIAIGENTLPVIELASVLRRFGPPILSSASCAGHMTRKLKRFSPNWVSNRQTFFHLKKLLQNSSVAKPFAPVQSSFHLCLLSRA